ncbi:Nif11-like leader peptide family natural product precursor [Synechococcus sp. UW179A]|uniref:Nif11-like leader peptide family natural product precursor n=1 Tax=Synechococcus sp. UW179A TaxID=2575510 RepID=UPI000E0F13A6|nr:Nif11-like leader peptide family natural product precursor [Synechococcus sp. UW179A]
MSEEQLKAFLAKAKDDQSIQDKLKAAKTPEDVVAIAKEHGHEFTDVEFTGDKITALSEEELEGVAGGCVITQVCGWVEFSKW